MSGFGLFWKIMNHFGSSRPKVLSKICVQNICNGLERSIIFQNSQNGPYSEISENYFYQRHPLSQSTANGNTSKRDLYVGRIILATTRGPTCIAEDMLSLSLRISCKFFVPKMFLRVVWESNLNKELSSFPSYFMFCQSFGNCLTIILALWSGGRSLHLQRLRLHLRPCIIVFKTLYNFSSSFETLYKFFRFFFFFFLYPI